MHIVISEIIFQYYITIITCCTVSLCQFSSSSATAAESVMVDTQFKFFV